MTDNDKILQHLWETYSPPLEETDFCDCDPNLINGFLENRLLPKEVARFEEHLATCPICQEMVIALSEEQDATIPPQLSMQKSVREVTLLASVRSYLGRGAAVIAAILIGIISLTIFNRSETRTITPIVAMNYHTESSTPSISSRLKEQSAYYAHVRNQQELQKSEPDDALFAEASPTTTDDQEFFEAPSAPKKEEYISPQLSASPLEKKRFVDESVGKGGAMIAKVEKKFTAPSPQKELAIDEETLRDQPLAVWESDDKEEAVLEISPPELREEVESPRRSQPPELPKLSSPAPTGEMKQSLADKYRSATRQKSTKTSLFEQYEQLQRQVSFAGWKFPHAVLPQKRIPVATAEQELKQLMIDFNHFLDQNPNDLEAHLRLIEIYADLNEWDRVVEMCTEVKSVDVRRTNMAAIALSELGRISEAKAKFEQALNEDETYPDTYFNLAIFSEKLTEFETAKQYWQEYLGLSVSTEWKKIARQHLLSLENK